VENGVAINSNLNAHHIDQQSVTLKKVFESKYKYPWIEETPVGHKTPHVGPIIPREVLTSEAQRCISSLEQKSKKK